MLCSSTSALPPACVSLSAGGGGGAQRGPQGWWHCWVLIPGPVQAQGVAQGEGGRGARAAGRTRPPPWPSPTLTPHPDPPTPCRLAPSGSLTSATQPGPSATAPAASTMKPPAPRAGCTISACPCSASTPPMTPSPRCTVSGGGRGPGGSPAPWVLVADALSLCLPSHPHRGCLAPAPRGAAGDSPRGTHRLPGGALPPPRQLHGAALRPVHHCCL